MFYKELIEKYGDIVHKVYFGSVSSQESNALMIKISTDFPPEKFQDLAPDAQVVTLIVKLQNSQNQE